MNLRLTSSAPLALTGIGGVMVGMAVANVPLVTTEAVNEATVEVGFIVELEKPLEPAGLLTGLETTGSEVAGLEGAGSVGDDFP